MISDRASLVSLNSSSYEFAGGGLCTYGNFFFICRFSHPDHEIFLSSSPSMGPRVNGMQAFLSRLAEFVSSAVSRQAVTGARCLNLTLFLSCALQESSPHAASTSVSPTETKRVPMVLCLFSPSP